MPHAFRGKALKGLCAMKKEWKKRLICGIAMAVICGNTAFAAEEPGEILSFGTEEKNIVLYVQDPGGEYEIQCQIGTEAAEQVESHRIAEDEVPMKTIILLDNSLSTVEKYRPQIASILSELAANRMNGEQFSIATFSDQPNYIIQESADYAAIKQAIGGISYEKQETYLTDVLYDMLEEMNEENNAVLKRIILISDGADDKSIGYTKEELYSLLEKTPYPIFTLGCTNGDNAERLKNMFALSRITGGEAYLLDDVTDPMEIVAEVAEMNKAVRVIITPKKTDCDGTRRGINLTITSSGQAFSDSVEMTMPFATNEGTENASSEIQREMPMKYILIAVGIVGVLLIGYAVIFFKRRQEDANAFIPAAPPEERNQNAVPDAHLTRMLGAEEESGERGTVFLWGEEMAHTLVMEDVHNPLKHFEAALDNPVMVGYNDSCKICLNYDETVSGEHCLISFENGKAYVENKSRTNGTILNGRKIESKTEIYSGCVLVLGRLNMKIEIQ